MEQSIYVQLPTGYVPQHITLESIALAVCSHFNVTMQQVTSKTRYRPIIDARHIIGYFSRMYTRHTYTEIGTFLGGRDHTTVISSVRLITNLLATGDPITDHVAQLERMLNERKVLRTAA